MGTIKHILLSLIILGSSVCFAQPGFEKVYGANGYDYGYSVQQTFDRGYIVAGATTSFGNGNTDAYLLKVDSLGVGKWHKTFGDINIDQAYCVRETADSGLVIAGYTNSYGNGGYDMYLIRTDSNGILLWSKTYGGSNWDFAYSVQPTSDGGFIIAGGTFSYGYGNEDFYVVKTDSNGDTLWTKTYGGTLDEEAKSIIQTPDGGYLLTGYSKSFGDLNGDIFTVKTDSNGDTLWTHLYAGHMEDCGNEVVNKPSGDYMLAGKSRDFSDNSLCGFRYDISPTGMMYGADSSYNGTDDDYLVGLNIMPDGRPAFLGNTFSYGFGLGTSDFKLDIWNPYNGFHGPTFGQTETETAYSLDNTYDGGYIMCGISNSFTPLNHIYLVKTDSNGVSAGSTSVVLTGLEENNDKGNFLLFPNPASERIQADLSTIDSKEINIKVYNMIGQVVYKELLKNHGEHFEMKTEDLPDGVYFFQLQTELLNITKKFIIQH